MLDKEFSENPGEASINAFVIQSADDTILVDAGSGQLFGPGYGGNLLDSLASVGGKPQDVTEILITHSRTDHTGGLVRDSQPAFPNATVYVGTPDLKFFLDTSHAKKTGYAERYLTRPRKPSVSTKSLGK